MHTMTSPGARRAFGPRGSRCSRRLARACWAALLVACGVPDDPLTSERFMLAEGEFRDLTWGGTQEDGFYVVAERSGASRDDGLADAVVITPDAPPCGFGPVSWYSAVRPARLGPVAIRAPSPARIPWIGATDGQGYGTLRFVSTRCEVSDFAVEGVRGWQLQLVGQVHGTELGYAAVDRDGALLIIDPWEERVEVIAENVADWQRVGDGLWLIGAGQLRLQTLDGDVRLRLGSDVRSFRAASSRLEVVYQDGDAVFRWSEARGRTERLAEGACEPRYLDTRTPLIGYFSPCESRQLTLHGPRDGKLASAPVARSVEEVASAAPHGLFYTTPVSTAEGSDRELWQVTWPEAEPRSLGRVGRLRDVSQFTLDGLRVHLLVLEQPDGFLRLGAWDGRDIGMLANDVQAVRYGFGRVAVVTRPIEGAGTLRVIRPSLWESAGAQATTELTASGVPPSGASFVFGGVVAGLAYLQGYDTERRSADLDLVMLSSGDHLAIAQDVTEYASVWWPELGIVYQQNTPGAQGVGFARIDVPCEQTGASALECAF